MTQTMLIREEKDSDYAVISEITIAAFKKMEISNHTEHFIVNALRKAGALALSLVAEIDGVVVGHIAFSPVSMSDGTKDWYGLGPLSVHPDYQRRGVGKALIEKGLTRLKKRNAKGCCLVGHPEYYPRFGFKNADGLILDGIPPEVFLFFLFITIYRKVM
ncbi:GNAT family N-acetyltransferase [Vibrio salinus]|uniref:GNAT family N-acetyltransferase n=1 Tax=Vibrio salinus TaxID=2899784 RepID=UPI001E32B7BC|nr:N-acetyltransferase [Vibrio salinus]MCE0495471.1 N-acetyltransferase [Vibrio salinus]